MHARVVGVGVPGIMCVCTWFLFRYDITRIEPTRVACMPRHTGTGRFDTIHAPREDATTLTHKHRRLSLLLTFCSASSFRRVPHEDDERRYHY